MNVIRTKPSDLHLRVSESVKLKLSHNTKDRNMKQSTHQPLKLRSIVMQYKHDAISVLMSRSELSDHPDLFNKLYSYYCEHGIMPYGIAKVRSGCPYNWISQRLAQDMQKNDGSLEFKDMPWETKPKFKTKAEKLFGESNTDVGW